MSHKFDDFMRELDEEVRRGGPKALAEQAAFGAFHRLALEVFELRKARGLTQRQLGATAGIQQAEISRIEAGNSNPTLSTIAALAQALGAELSLSPAKPPRSSPRSTATGRRRAPSRAAARHASYRHAVVRERTR
jgi:transcriptional regulator with XRE-family HTH domain